MLIRYQRADCTRFRTPPIDTSVVYRSIEQLFLEAWQQGTPAQQAYQQLLRDTRITDVLRAQVASNLGFQRAVAVHGVEAEVAKERKSYEAQRLAALETITVTVGQELCAAERVRGETQEALARSRQGYTAATADLEGLRHRVASKISTLGGASGMQALLEINSAVTGQPYASSKLIDGGKPYATSTPPTRVLRSPSPTITSPTLEQRARSPHITSTRMSRRRSLWDYFVGLFIQR